MREQDSEAMHLGAKFSIAFEKVTRAYYICDVAQFINPLLELVRILKGSF